MSWSMIGLVGDYGPSNLTEKMAWPGAPNSVVPSEATSGGQVVTAIADYTQSTDITAPRGYIGPADPYSKPAPAAPTITSLTPNTGVSGAGKPPIWTTIAGTGFTQWTTVETGGVTDALHPLHQPDPHRRGDGPAINSRHHWRGRHRSRRQDRRHQLHLHLRRLIMATNLDSFPITASDAGAGLCQAGRHLHDCWLARRRPPTSICPRPCRNAPGAAASAPR